MSDCAGAMTIRRQFTMRGTIFQRPGGSARASWAATPLLSSISCVCKRIPRVEPEAGEVDFQVGWYNYRHMRALCCRIKP
jgi:hypothetical protein